MNRVGNTAYDSHLLYKKGFSCDRICFLAQHFKFFHLQVLAFQVLFRVHLKFLRCNKSCIQGCLWVVRYGKTFKLGFDKMGPFGTFEKCRSYRHLVSTQNIY